MQDAQKEMYALFKLAPKDSSDFTLNKVLLAFSQCSMNRIAAASSAFPASQLKA